MGVAASGRLLIVSNRLPVTVRVEKGRLKLVESMGGLATGMRPAHERTRGLWFGWPGALRRLDPRQRKALEAELARRHLVPIHLTQTELRRYYHGYSNGVLWPLFHYALDRLPLASSDWSEYCRVNERFADAVAKEYRPGDLVWVHDYQLALVPALLRERVPTARIAFFLHTPFPASEVYRVLPQRAEILRGILGADLVGFHTLSYLRHFSVSVLRLLGQETDIDRIWHEERDVRLGVYPMGIDVQAFEAAAQDPKVIAESETIRRQAGGASIVLGVDRLDYSKGIPRRLLAFERLLQREPDLRGRVRFIQVAAPSRGEIRAYADFERTVAELVGRINGQYGTAAWTPIQYLHQAVPQKRVVALYRAADVMAVTPLRDGLNLVAKEYVASRPDLGGCLLLSEFAGAAADMPEAVVVNPFDLDGMAKSMVEAVRMDASERARRMRALRERLQQGDVHRWCQTILDDLRGATAPRPTAPRVLAAEVLEKLLVQARTAERTVIFLDYDGTLVPIRPHPDLAAPDARLLVLLRQLGQRPGTSVHVVSGRDAETLER
jgi:trehalose 6-phosphate synthase/phosphatase